MEIPAEVYLAKMHGRIDALAHLCLALLVTHQDGRAILLATKLDERVKSEAAAAAKNEQQQAYLEGMTEIVDHMRAGLRTAALAAQVKDLGPQGGH